MCQIVCVDFAGMRLLNPGRVHVSQHPAFRAANPSGWCLAGWCLMGWCLAGWRLAPRSGLRVWKSYRSRFRVAPDAVVAFVLVPFLADRQTLIRITLAPETSPGLGRGMSAARSTVRAPTSCTTFVLNVSPRKEMGRANLPVNQDRPQLDERPMVVNKTYRFPDKNLREQI